MKNKKFIRKRQFANIPKKCFFCEEKKEPSFFDVATLQKFLTERQKIIGSARNGFCAKHQKKLAVEIKHARHLALLPFVGQR